MGDVVSEDTYALESKIDENYCSSDFMREFKVYYRIIRKNISRYIKQILNKNFYNILYITPDKLPNEYIIAIRKQYPDKIFKVLVPHFGDTPKHAKEIFSFEYFSRNKKHVAYCYKHLSVDDNIEIYSVYSDEFSLIKNHADIYQIEYMQAFVKCCRFCVKKLKPEIIHVENIPYFLGVELNGRQAINSKNPKVFQVFHDLNIYTNLEPFWAVINIADKKSFNRLINDKNIKKNLAALFGLKCFKHSSKISDCINYLYENFENYRKSFPENTESNENILLSRLNQRTVELFPKLLNNKSNLYNPIVSSAKFANAWGTNTLLESDKLADIDKDKYYYLNRKCMVNFKDKIHVQFDKENFRKFRSKNKEFIIKEFSERSIETGFTDTRLFLDTDVKISGYIDSFYKGVLIFIPVNRFMKEEDIKLVLSSVLNVFKARKNIQIIINVGSDVESNYLNSFKEFIESQQILSGKWLMLEGNINLSQILASTDIILLTNGYSIGLEDLIYMALNYGCIPVVENRGVCGNIVTDIFDDMTLGTGFKKAGMNEKQTDEFEQTLLKAIEFYTKTSSSWNSIVKNAINNNYSWNFDLLQQYNDIYENL